MEEPIVIEDSMTRVERIALQLTMNGSLSTRIERHSTHAGLCIIALFVMLLFDSKLREGESLIPEGITIAYIAAIAVWFRWVDRDYSRAQVDASESAWPTRAKYSICDQQLVVCTQFGEQTTLPHRNLVSARVIENVVVFQWQGFVTVQIHLAKMTSQAWQRMRDSAPTEMKWPDAAY